MGYYYKNNYETALNVNNAELTSDLYICDGETVEIVNNESIRFDFRKFIQESNMGSILLEKEKENLLHKEQESPIRLEKQD